jgi:hypothetical protein
VCTPSALPYRARSLENQLLALSAMIDAVSAFAGSCVRKIQQLLQFAMGRLGLQKFLPLDLEGLNAFAQPLVFRLKPDMVR